MIMGRSMCVCVCVLQVVSFARPVLTLFFKQAFCLGRHVTIHKCCILTLRNHGMFPAYFKL